MSLRFGLFNISPSCVTAQLKPFSWLINFIEKFVSVVRAPLTNDICRQRRPSFPQREKEKEEEGHGPFRRSGNLVMGT